jgi:N-acetylglucosaminyldiphosphoundecaprenol N-acetyl-beta-D-mannosaminyltransferase
LVHHKVYEFANIKISLPTLANAAKQILKASQEDSNHFHLIAASTFYGINGNMLLQSALKTGTNFCDSKPLSTWIKLIFGNCEQIRGTDLLREVLKISDSKTSHFFVGTTTDNLEKLKTEIKQRYPLIHFSGFLAPPFFMPSSTDLRIWAHEIRESNANVVWLSLGSPKQDIVAAELSQYCDATIVAIGAAVDFITGSKAEAPALVQNLHLEWMFRFLHEPKRLWKRYTIGNVYFVNLIARDFLTKIAKR